LSAKKVSLKEDQGIQAARERVEKRAAIFGLKENKTIDDEGDCQFDAVADQLRKYGQFLKETKESVRTRAVEWIRSHADYDLGNDTSVKQWVLELPEKNGSFDGYIAKMRGKGYWGDEVTLLAIIEAYQVGVCLVSSTVGEENWFRTFCPRGVEQKIEGPLLWLGLELERHYWSLVGDNFLEFVNPMASVGKGGESSEFDVIVRIHAYEDKLDCSFLLKVEAQMTISELKRLIMKRTGLRTDVLELHVHSKLIDNDKLILQEYGITSGSYVDVVVASAPTTTEITVIYPLKLRKRNLAKLMRVT
jgi:hypothetical protein